MPRSYWDYDSVNIQWGILENYEVVRKIGSFFMGGDRWYSDFGCANRSFGSQVGANTRKCSRG